MLEQATCQRCRVAFLRERFRKHGVEAMEKVPEGEPVTVGATIEATP